MSNEKFFRKLSGEFSARSDAELSSNEKIKEELQRTLPLLGEKWDIHLPVFLSTASLARMLWLDFVYQKAIDVPGQLVEFGSQWGASLNVFVLLKLIREPWNISRKMNSFSTFGSGFLHVGTEDGNMSMAGDYSTREGWQLTLRELIETHAARSPIGAANNVEIFCGDAGEIFPAWLDANPEALISHAHFDMDVYQPTKDVLSLCLPRMPKGAILIFDELNCPSFPGETRAVQEVLNIHSLSLRKSQYQPYSAYCVVE